MQEENKELEKEKNNNTKKAAKKVKRKKKKDRLGFNWFFWISFVMIAIPVGFFIWILVTASQEGSSPVLGDRVTSEVAVEITDESLTTIANDIEDLENVESYEVNLTAQTVRITLDVTDTLTEEEMLEITTQAYEIVDSYLPIASYFTATEELNEYDLEIYAYTNLDDEEGIILILYKNSTLESYYTQTLTTAVNQSTADELQELIDEANGENEEEETSSDEGSEEDTTSEEESTSSEENG